MSTPLSVYDSSDCCVRNLDLHTSLHVVDAILRVLDKETGNGQDLFCAGTLLWTDTSLLILGQIHPDGIAVPTGRGFTILDGLPGAFVDAAQALEALRCPYWLSVPESNCVSRAVSRTLAASVADILGKEGLCTSGEFVEPEVGEMRLHPGQRPLVNPIYPFVLLDLAGDPPQLLPGGGDLLDNHVLIIGIGADDIVVGHP